MGGTGRHLRAGGSRRRVLVAALIAVAAALGPGAAAASAVTDVVMFSDPGDFIGLGHSQLFTAANAAITAHTQAFAIVDVEVNGGPLGDTFSLEFAAPPGQPFVPGVYENAQRASFRTAGHPGIDVFGDGRGCSGDDGRFEVRDVAIAPDGTVSRLWLGYEQHCEGSAPALYGEVRIGEPAPPGAGFPAPSAVRWPPIDLGAPTTVLPVTFVATVPDRITGASVAGPQAAAFPIRLDECTGVALAAGATCQVFVRFTPSAAGDAGAVLHLTDAAGTAYDVPLAGFAIGGLTRVDLHSDPGDFVGGGTDRVFTPADAAIGLAGSRQSVGMAFSGAAGANWDATFAPAPGDIIAPGAYPGATRYPFNTVGPGLDVSGEGRGCNTLTGSFVVTTATFGPDGRAQSFGATFVQHCEAGVPALTGTVAFRVGAFLPPPGVPLLGGGAGAGGAAVAPPVVGAAGAASIAVPSAPPPPAAVNAAAARTPRACAGLRFTAARVLGGTARGDRIRGTAHGDLIVAGAGNDRVVARGGSDCVDGGTGADVLAGDAGADVLAGGAGGDRLLGGTGDDRLQGGAGDDRLDGGPGRDVLDCGPGRDVAVATRGDITRGCERVIRRGRR